MSNSKHIGSSFDEFLQSEGLLEESAAVAVERVMPRQGADAANEAAKQTPGTHHQIA